MGNAKNLIFASIVLVIFLFSGCGTLLPNIATVYVKNTFSTLALRDLTLVDARIHGAGIESQKSIDIAKNEEKGFQLSWYGDEASFALAAKLKYGDSPVGELNDIYSIKDVENGDVIQLFFDENNNCKGFVRVTKNYTYGGSGVAVGSKRQ